MEERIVIKGTPQKNKIAIITLIVGIVIAVASFFVAEYAFNNVRVRYFIGDFFMGYYEYCIIYDSFDDFFTAEFFNIDCYYYGYMLIVGLIAAIVGIIVKVNTEKCEITVTNQMIMGKLPRGKEVSIPMNQITAINPSSFNGISISSIGNVSNFHCFENRDEVMKAISYLLTNPQQATANATQSTVGATIESTGEAEQLKRLKELLDAGVITQEEFDVKKKQILGF